MTEQVGTSWSVFLDPQSLRTTLAALGPWAIVLLGISAAVYQPFGPDVFVVSSSLIGIPAGWAAGLATLSTLIGATLGYGLGAGIFGPVLRGLFRRKTRALAKARIWLAQRGVWVVAVSAFTPFPLTQVSWAAGGLRLPFGRFVVGLVLGLVPRFALEALFAGILRRWIA